MAVGKFQLVPYDSEDDGPEDPMVSKPIHPFIIPITIVIPQSAQHGRYGALIDSGCTQCLTSQAVVTALGIRVREMAKPVRFEQVDGSLLGGGSLQLPTSQSQYGWRWESIGRSLGSSWWQR